MHSMSACAGMPKRRRTSTVCLHDEPASVCMHVRSCAYLRSCMRERVRMLADACSGCQHAFATMVSTLVASLQESCALRSRCPLLRTAIASARTAQSRILHDELRTMHATRRAICGQGERKGAAEGASARPAHTWTILSRRAARLSGSSRSEASDSTEAAEGGRFEGCFTGMMTAVVRGLKPTQKIKKQHGCPSSMSRAGHSSKPQCKFPLALPLMMMPFNCSYRNKNELLPLLVGVCTAVQRLLNQVPINNIISLSHNLPLSVFTIA